MDKIPMRSLIIVVISLFTGVLHAQVPRLWGMTPMGGTYNKGTLFRVDGDGTDFTVEFHFDSLSGYSPEGSLCLAPSGVLYGMTNLGGEGSIPAGTLFKFDPDGAGFTKLVDFDLSNGGFGWGGMVAADDGMLYGATYGGGGGSGGSIFRLDPDNDTYTILHPLDQPTDGGAVTNVLMQADDDKLYGSCAYGGVNNAGTLFSYDIDTDTYTKLHDFDGTNGSTPYSALCQADDGWLYGTTYDGGANDQGTFFRYDPVGDVFTKLLDFDGTNGQSPWTTPVRVEADKLYIAITLGGSVGSGLIASYVPSTDTFTEEHGFNGLDGGLLFGSVTLADGELYGLASFGGTNFQGAVYRFDPVTTVLTTLYSFNAVPDGYSPRGELTARGTATGIAEPDGAIAFGVYPNPSDGDLTLTIADMSPVKGRLLIGDALGRVVQEVLIDQASHLLHLEGPPGVYTLTLTTAQAHGSRVIVLE